MSQASIEHITVDEKGVARLLGRRTKVLQVVIDKQAGMSVEEIHAAYPHLSLAEIYAALAYYFDHQQQLDEQIRLYHETVDEAEKDTDPAFYDRLRARANRT